MKILYVINSLGFGGAEKLIEQTLPLLNNREDIQVDLLLLSKKQNIYDQKLFKKGMNIYYSPFNNCKNPLNVFKIKKVLNNKKYDIVHVHLFPSLYLVSIADKLMLSNNAKMFYTEHSTYNNRRDKKILRPIEAWIYSSFDKIFSISTDTQNNLMKWLKKNSEDNKFKVIHNGIDVQHFKHAIPYYKEEIIPTLNEDDFLLCMVGRFSKPKDQMTIIKSLKRLPNHIHLILLGDGDELYNNKRLAKELKLENRIHFLGFREDINRILKTCDVNVISSIWEGFSLAAVEGMAAAKPVVATNVDGLKEIIHCSHLLFNVGDDFALSEIIHELSTNREYYDKLRSYFFERAENYDIKLMADKLTIEYKNILQ